MKICFPVATDDGLASKVYNHFGSAQRFIVVDTETGATLSINNGDKQHVHGACSPLRALAGNPIDAVVVGGIGAGALTMLNRAQIRVFCSQAATVGENVELFKSGAFQEIAPQTCGGHSHGHGCAH